LTKDAGRQNVGAGLPQREGVLDGAGSLRLSSCERVIEVNTMTAKNEGRLVTEQLEQMIKLLGSLRSSIASGVPRDLVAEVRDDIQSLTSAVQILSRTLKRRSKNRTYKRAVKKK